MAGVAACWAKWPASCPAENPGASGAFRLTGSTGGCPKLNEQVDRVEQIVLETRARLAQSESQCGQLAQKGASNGFGRPRTRARLIVLCTS